MIKKIFFAAVLLVCAQAAMADNVLYAQVEGTNMTLKYGEKPADSGSIKNYQFDGTSPLQQLTPAVPILMAIAREPSSMDSQNLLL